MRYSALVIARNEQLHIAGCIENVQQLSDEVIVIDDFSSDDTAEIASAMGAEVIQRRLEDNWARQRNFGLEQVTNDWTLILDSDERLDPVATSSLERFVPAAGIRAAKIARLNYYKGQPLYHGRFMGDMQYRAVRSDVRYRLDRPVHEVPEVDPEQVVVLEGYIEHFTYESLNELLAKTRHYSRVQGESGQPMFERPFLVQAVRNVGRIPLQGAYRDGMPGLITVFAEIYGNYVMSQARRRISNLDETATELSSSVLST